MKRVKHGFRAVAVSCLVLLAACGGGDSGSTSQGEGGTVVVGMRSDFKGFNPIVTSLRGIQQAGELKRVQKKLGCPRASLGSMRPVPPQPFP